MLRIFPTYRVTLLESSREKEFFFFVSRQDADWFASLFPTASVDLVHTVSLFDCSEDEVSSYVNLIRYGTSTIDK